MEIFTFLSWLFGYAEERLDKKVNPKRAWGGQFDPVLYRKWGKGTSSRPLFVF